MDRREIARLKETGSLPSRFLGPAEYLQKLEDLYWVARAKAAEDNGAWVSHEEAISVLTEQLKRPG